MVEKAAAEVIAGAVSIGMSLDTCTVPGSPREERIPDGQAELGLGIHGEAGVTLVDFAGAAAAMQMVVARLAPHMGAGDHVALLNNLGSTTPLEMSVLAEELARSDIGSRVRFMVGPGPLMTSLDMHGFSLSLLPVSPAQVEALKAPAAPHAWPGCLPFGQVATRPLPDGLAPVAPVASAHPAHRALVDRCARALIAIEADLNALDAKSGDGDTGSTLAGAARALIAALDRLPLADATQLYRAIGNELAQTMGGSSGVLLAIFFAAAGDASAGGRDWIGALSAGLDRVMQVGGAAPGHRTMIDALAPALAALPQGLPAAAAAARAGADATAGMTRAKAGRATYLSEDKLKGHKDPGAEGVARLFETLAAAPANV
jgi:dihydroxyacetone kinase